MAVKTLSLSWGKTVSGGKRRPQVRLTKLTKRERQFAEENHGIVLWFLGKWKLDQSEYYDVVIFGYLRSVKLWHKRKDLHKYSFTTIAKNKMYSALENYWAKEKKRIRTVSLDALIEGKEHSVIDFVTYENIV